MKQIVLALLGIYLFCNFYCNAEIIAPSEYKALVKQLGEYGPPWSRASQQLVDTAMLKNQIKELTGALKTKDIASRKYLNALTKEAILARRIRTVDNCTEVGQECICSNTNLPGICTTNKSLCRGVFMCCNCSYSNLLTSQDLVEWQKKLIDNYIAKNFPKPLTSAELTNIAKSKGMNSQEYTTYWSKLYVYSNLQRVRANLNQCNYETKTKCPYIEDYENKSAFKYWDLSIPDEAMLKFKTDGACVGKIQNADCVCQNTGDKGACWAQSTLGATGKPRSVDDIILQCTCVD